MAFYKTTLKICLHDDLALNQQHSYISVHHDMSIYQQTLIYLHHDITSPTN